ncbi:MAG: hypothetical protein ABIO83_02405 [Ilumatobacteraceae bacterium]
MNTLTFRDAFERVATTIIEAILAYLISTSFTDDDFWRGFLVVLVVGVASGLKVLFTQWVPTFQSWTADMIYRAVSTFVVTFAGAYAAAGFLDIVNTSVAEQAAFAGITAALSVVKSGIAIRRPAGVTPASLVTPAGNLAA